MKRWLLLAALLLLAAAALLAAPLVGGERIGLSAIGAAEGTKEYAILWQLRVPRVLTGFLAGTGLAVAGMVFQALFRNPLATPFTLGVSSGASLGVAVGIFCGLSFRLLGISSQTWLAFAGALATIVLVYGLARTRQGLSSVTMLLAGVAVSFFFSAVILFLQYLADFSRSYQMLRWVMGGMEGGMRYDDVLRLLPFVATGCLTAFCLAHELNLITTGEELAAARGVEVRRMKLTLFFVTSLMVGAIVATCGPIGFVGLMVPHIGRLVIGADHRWLAPATCLFGGAFLVLCDTAARTVLAPTELPVGILTSLLGGPFFLWLLFARTEAME